MAIVSPVEEMIARTSSFQITSELPVSHPFFPHCLEKSIAKGTLVPYGLVEICHSLLPPLCRDASIVDSLVSDSGHHGYESILRKAADRFWSRTVGIDSAGLHIHRDKPR